MKQERRELTPDEIEKLETMSGYRLPMQQIAAILGMSKSTLERCCKKDDAARGAVEKGRALASAAIIQSAYAQAIGGNTTMLIFWLKTQEGWRETSRLELCNPDGSPIIEARELTSDQRQKRLDRYKTMLDATERKKELTK